MEIDIQQIKEEAVPILRSHDVVESALFGSVAKGKATSESDVDFLVRFTGSKTLFDLIDLKDKLEQRLARRVDIVTYDSLNARIRDSVLRYAIPLFS